MMAPISTVQWYRSTIISLAAGNIGERLAKEMRSLTGQFRHEKSAFHEAAHVVLDELFGGSEGAVVYPDGSGLSQKRIPGYKKGFPKSPEDCQGPGDDGTIAVVLQWARDDGFDLNEMELRAEAEKLLRENWKTVEYYARNLLLNNGRLEGKTHAWIMEPLKDK
jgi:hypothetical protein